MEASGRFPMWEMLTVAALALAAGCAAERSVDGEETSAQVPYETFLDETQSGLDQPLSEVVRDEATWVELWDRIHRGVTPRLSPPAVDFSRHMLIAVATGTRPSGGFNITVQSVVAHEGRLEVEVLETCPAPDAIVTMALTRPVEVVRLDRVPQGPVFRHSRSPSCE
jgi:hypothetical protein